MNGKYYVIAGNALQANEFIKRKAEEMWWAGYSSITLSNFVYVADVLTLKGVSEPHGFFVGTWRERQDILGILCQLMVTTQGKASIKKFIELEDEVTRAKSGTTNSHRMA